MTHIHATVACLSLASSLAFCAVPQVRATVAYVAGEAASPYAAPAGTKPFPRGPFDAKVKHPAILPESAIEIAATLRGEPYQLGKLQFSTASDGRADAAVPVYIAHQSDPRYTIHCMRFTGCPLEGAAVAIPRGALPASNLGYNAFTDDGTHDQHMALRNLDTRVETDMWLTPQPSGTGGRLDIGYGARFPFSGDGVGQAGATAAGFALTVGRIRAVDLLAGRIPYALFLVTPCENGHVAPATGDDGGHDAGCPPIGARVWLDSPHADIAASGASADAKVILEALHEFGGFIGDRCTSCSLNVAIEGGLTFTAFGLPNPWAKVGEHYSQEAPSWPYSEYHIAVGTGNIDLSRHLHVIAYP